MIMATYACTPPGSGVRVGLDRDQDGVLDGDEKDAGSDPANADSTIPAGGGGDTAATAQWRQAEPSMSKAPPRLDRGGAL